MFLSSCGWSQRGVARTRMAPVPVARPGMRTWRLATLAVVGTGTACGTTHGALSLPAPIGAASPRAIVAPLPPSPLLEGGALLLASRLASADDPGLGALLIDAAATDAIPLEQWTDWTRTPGLDAWNCEERGHFKPSAAIRSDLDAGIASIDPVVLR